MDVVITELARSTKALAELGGRTHPLVADVVVALVDMGLCRLLLRLLFCFINAKKITCVFRETWLSKVGVCTSVFIHFHSHLSMVLR